jgi:serine/threonine protein kinase
MSTYNEAKTKPAKEPVVRSGNYMLGRTLGEGSFGKVKLAHHVKTEQVVAIKIVDKGGMVDVDDVDRIYREVLILTHLKHRNIIKLIEVYDAGKSIMLAMEFAGGGDLYEFWKQKKVRTRYVYAFVCAVDRHVHLCACGEMLLGVFICEILHLTFLLPMHSVYPRWLPVACFIKSSPV